VNKTPSWTKKKIIAIELVILIVASTTLAYIYLSNFGTDSQKDITISQEDTLEEELDPTTEKVKELLQQLDESMIREHIEKLTSWGPHPTAFRIPYKLSKSELVNRPFIGRFFDLPITKVEVFKN